jgi:hypothetical protein
MILINQESEICYIALRIEINSHSKRRRNNNPENAGLSKSG